MENIEAQKEFLSKMLELIPDLEANGPEISSIVSTYSDMETYDVSTKNIILHRPKRKMRQKNVKLFYLVM